MAITLTAHDRRIIDEIFEKAKQQYGGTQQLFAAPLTYTDKCGSIKFQFPDWMSSIRKYLISQYGDREAATTMLDLMSEWISLSLKSSEFTKPAAEQTKIGLKSRSFTNSDEIISSQQLWGS